MPVLPSSQVVIRQPSFHAFDPLSPRRPRLERIAEVLGLVDHFSVLEFHDADRVERQSIDAVAAELGVVPIAAADFYRPG
jgi:hypothetical protein